MEPSSSPADAQPTPAATPAPAPSAQALASPRVSVPPPIAPGQQDRLVPVPPTPAGPQVRPSGPPSAAPLAATKSVLGLDRRTARIYAACAAVVVGALGPWGTVFGFVSVSGIGVQDGYISIVCAGLIAAMWGLKAPVGRVRRVAMALCGLAAVGVGAIYLVSYAGDDEVSVSWGLLLGTLAACALVVLVLRPDTRPRER